MITVRLTLLDIRIFETKSEKILKELPEELQKKALRYRKRDDQLRSIGSSFLLLKAAKGYEIRYNPEGKPYTDSQNFFNISHSGDYVVLAEADLPVGVDVEKVTDIGINDELKNIALSEREKFWVNDSLLRFFVIWTRKESLVKCDGCGFIAEPAQIETISDENNVNFDEPVNYRGKTYRIESFLLDGHVISVAMIYP